MTVDFSPHIANNLHTENFLAGADVIDLARSEQRASGVKLVGKNSLTEETKEHIDDFLRNDVYATNFIPIHSDLGEGALRLLLRFETLCNRRNVSFPNKQDRQFAYRILVTELHINNSLLPAIPVKELVTATLLNNELIGQFPREKGFIRLLQESPGLLRRALASNPAEVKDFLVRAKSSIKELQKIPGITNGTIKQVVFGHRNPEVFIKEALTLSQKIIKSREFTCFLKSRPWIARHAVITYGLQGGAQNFLRNAIKNESKIYNNQELEEFWDKPNSIARAIVQHPIDPERFLKESLKRCNSLLRKPKYKSLRKIRPSVLRISTRNPDTFQESIDRLYSL